MEIPTKYRSMAARIVLAYAGDSESPYLNIPYYQYRVDDTVPSDEVQSGPPSNYEDPDRTDRSKYKEDIRRNQGKNPYKDVFDSPMLPAVVTVLNEEKTDEQDKPTNDTTKSEARNENRDTVGFNPGEWTDPESDASPDQFNNPYL